MATDGRIPGIKQSAGLGALALLVALGLAAAPTPAQAREGATQANLYVGTTRFLADDASSYGTTIGASWGYEALDNLILSVAGAYATTDGKQRAAGNSYDITARTGSISGGATYYFNRSAESLLSPFLGAGISVLSYDVDYRFPGSILGKTSGIAPGGYALAGLELWLTRSTTFIATFQASGHDVKTQSGEQVTLRSTGLLLSLRFSAPR